MPSGRCAPAATKPREVSTRDAPRIALRRANAQQVHAVTNTNDDENDDARGDLLGGTGTRPPMGWGAVLSSLGLQPPGAALVSPAMTPRPPLLDGLDDADAWVEAMLHAWAAGVVSRYPSRLGHQRIPKGYDTGAKRDAVLACAHKLFAENIAPASWAAFVIDRWRAGYAPPNVRTATMPPSPSYVYRADAVTNALPIYRQTGAGYSGGRVVMGPKYHALHALWSALHTAMLKAKVRDATDAQQVVRRVFGDDLDVWERAVWEARTEARKLQQAMDDETKKGQFRW